MLSSMLGQSIFCAIRGSIVKKTASNSRRIRCTLMLQSSIGAMIISTAFSCLMELEP